MPRKQTGHDTETSSGNSGKRKLDKGTDSEESSDGNSLPLYFPGDVGHRNFVNHCLKVDYPRLPTQMTLHINPVGGIPSNGKTIGQVERAYFKLKELNETVAEKINALHPRLNVDKVVARNTLYYAISCKSLGALECLWHTYETLGMNKLVTSTTITDKTTREIGASYFSIQTTLDLEEYEHCKREIRDAGLPVDDVIEEQSKGAEVDLKKLNKKLRAERDELQDTVTSLKKKVDDCLERLSLLEATVKENTQVKANISKLEATIIEKNQVIERLRRENEEKDQTHKMLLEKVERLTKENAELRAARSSSESD